LLLEQGGAAIISARLSIREDGGHLIVTLHGVVIGPDSTETPSWLAGG
jgi:hypothetical protein